MKKRKYDWEELNHNIHERTEGDRDWFNEIRSRLELKNHEIKNVDDFSPRRNDLFADCGELGIFATKNLRIITQRIENDLRLYQNNFQKGVVSEYFSRDNLI